MYIFNKKKMWPKLTFNGCYLSYFAAPEDTLQVPEVRSVENNVGDHTDDGTGDNEGHVTVNGDIATEESENQETEEPMEEGMR